MKLYHLDYLKPSRLATKHLMFDILSCKFPPAIYAFKPIYVSHTENGSDVQVGAY